MTEIPPGSPVGPFDHTSTEHPAALICMQRDGVPVLPGFIDQRARAADLRVWCRWCCHWHTHGAVPAGTVVHRLAHCYAPDSAYRQSGYWIDVSDRPYREVAKSVRPATAAQQRAMCGGRVSGAVQRLRNQPPPEAP